VRLQVTGEQTEVDKAILEAIKDPLVHLLRNAIDHGIEAPEVRENLGKHRDGQLSLRAFPDGGYVIIELRDDGGGLNTEKIKQQAIAQGLVSAKQAETMTDSQIHRYIFAPGFSTAETITNLSGRGVGMDVVRSNIESISGQVQIASQANKGTTIRLKIPLSLSIIPTLLVSVNSEMFAIPEAVVTELVKITDEQLSSSVVHAGEASFVRLRNELLPLLSLRDYLGLDHSTATNGDFICIVLSVEGSRFGVAVDHVHNIEEIVVKSLDRQLQALLLYTGATILGDGRIVLILDPSSMLHHLHLHRPESIAQDASLGFEQSTSPSFGTDSFLVVETDATAHAAIPLGNVRRLEKLPPECIERIGDTPMIQYRGHILPIVSLAHNAPTELSKDAELSVVVLADTAGRELGLHVRGIVDICASLQSPTTTLHSTDAMQVGILDSHASLLLDVPELFRRIYGAQTEVQS
jgi:two-component system chemotaxis sensor kinase CheA